MLQGRDFLTNTGYANAVNMNLVVNKDELFLSILASAVRFPPLQLDHLCLDQSEMDSILHSPEEKLHHVSITDCWCHVLPSMKRGRIFSVSRGVPDSGPFKCYRDFKRHWKNMYGYRLPETDEDFFYYEVTFRASGCGKMFTYPGVCLRAMNIQRIPRVDCKPILVEFLQDLHSKMPSVCGHHLRFKPKLKYTVPGLYVGSEEKSHGAINLSNKNPAASAVPFRNINELQRVYTPHTQDKIAQQTRGATTTSVTSDLFHSQPVGIISHLTTQGVHKDITSTEASQSQTNITLSRPNIISTSHLNNLSTSHSNSTITLQSETTAKRVIPLFRPKTKPISSLSLSSDTSVKRSIPIFKAAVQKSGSRDNFGPQDNNSVYTEKKLEELRISHPPKPVFKPNKKSVPSCSSVKLVSNFSGLSSNLSQLTPAVDNNEFRSKTQQNLLGSTNGIITRPVSGCTPNFRTTGSTLPGKKRELTKTDAQDVEVKKPRPRQQVQEVDVEQLAQANQLGKVNSVTLLAWLKQRGVPCKSKDKKGDLVERVKHIVCLKHAES
ncbi:uncharacterized protein C18orf63-like isoform X2 [Gigantopelta aegis]|nr:uncharacterized protein C18orf63-like isoform X2 [Gigantopelta aegis]